MQCVPAMFASSSYQCLSHEDAICSVDLLKMSPSSSTSTGSQIATWRRSLTWTRREFSFDLQSLLTGKMFVWLPAFLSLNPVQRGILPHRQSQLSDVTIRLHITTSLKSISEIRWLYHHNVQKGAFTGSTFFYVNHVTNHSSFSLGNAL